MSEEKGRSKDRVRNKAGRKKGLDPEAATAAMWDHIGDNDDVPISSVVAGMGMRGRIRRAFSEVLQGCVLAGLFIVKILIIYQIAMIAAAWNSPRACKRLEFKLEKVIPAARVACFLVE